MRVVSTILSLRKEKEKKKTSRTINSNNSPTIARNFSFLFLNEYPSIRFIEDIYKNFHKVPLRKTRYILLEPYSSRSIENER